MIRCACGSTMCKAELSIDAESHMLFWRDHEGERGFHLGIAQVEALLALLRQTHDHLLQAKEQPAEGK